MSKGVHRADTREIRLHRRFRCPECGVGVILNFPHHVCRPTTGWDEPHKQAAIAELRDAFRPRQKHRSKKELSRGASS